MRQPALLFGRERLVRDLIEHALDRDRPVSQSLVGLTRTGKTSILNCIEQLRHAELCGYMIQHFQLDAAQLFPLHRVLFVPVNCMTLHGQVSQAFWREVSHQLREAATIRGFGPTGLALSPDYAYTDWYAVREMLERLARQQCRVLLLLDEFDRVAAEAPGALETLSALLEDLPQQLVAIMATRKRWGAPSARPANDHDSDHLQSIPYPADRHVSAPLRHVRQPQPSRFAGNYQFKNHGPQGYVGLLEPDGALGYIRSLAGQHDLTFTATDIAFALRVGGRHPDLTRITCQHLYDARNAAWDGPIDYARVYSDILDEFEQLFNCFWPELDTRWQTILGDLMSGASCFFGVQDLRMLDALGIIVTETSARFTLFSPIFEEHLESKFGTPLLLRLRTPTRLSRKYPKPLAWLKPRHASTNAGSELIESGVYAMRRTSESLTSARARYVAIRTRKVSGGRYSPPEPLLYAATVALAAATIISIGMAVFGRDFFRSVLSTNSWFLFLAATGADMLAVGFAAWRITRVIEKRVNRLRRARKPPAEAAVSTGSERRRALLLDLAVASMAGIISGVLVPLILSFFRK